eukprot:COSAG04_NODE_4388_length_2125_cov_3.295163_2_plen_94_part_01
MVSQAARSWAAARSSAAPGAQPAAWYGPRSMEGISAGEAKFRRAGSLLTPCHAAASARSAASFSSALSGGAAAAEGAGRAQFFFGGQKGLALSS